MPDKKFENIARIIKGAQDLTFINLEDLITAEDKESGEFKQNVEALTKKYIEKYEWRHPEHPRNKEYAKTRALREAKIFCLNGKFKKDRENNTYVKRIKESLKRAGLNNIKKCEVMSGFSFAIKVTLEDGYTFFIKKDNFVEERKEQALKYILGYKALYSLGIGSKFDFSIQDDGSIIFISQDLNYSKNKQVNERKFSEKTEHEMPKAEENKLNFFGNVLMMSDVKIVDEYDETIMHTPTIDKNGRDVQIMERKTNKENRKNCGVVVKKEKENKAKIFDFAISEDGGFLSVPYSDLQQDHLLNTIKYNKAGEFIKKADRANWENEEKANFLKLLEINFKATVQQYLEYYKIKLDINSLWELPSGCKINQEYNLQNEPAENTLQALCDYKNQVIKNFSNTLLKCDNIKDSYEQLKKMNEDYIWQELGSRFNLMAYYNDKAYQNHQSQTSFTQRKAFIESKGNYDDYGARKTFLEHCKQGNLSDRQINKLKDIAIGKDENPNLTSVFPKSSRILAIQNAIEETSKSPFRQTDEARKKYKDETIKELASNILKTKGITYDPQSKTFNTNNSPKI